MTLTEFKDREHVFKYGDSCVITISEHVCLGFTHGSKITIWRSDVAQSTNYVPTLTAIFARDYKRFPMKRFAKWLYGVVCEHIHDLVVHTSVISYEDFVRNHPITYSYKIVENDRPL